MSKVVVYIETDNAAFDDDAYGFELAKIFRKLASKCEGTTQGDLNDCMIHDTNGNKVGNLRVED